MIDEFHHAAAPSYQELLEYYKPKVLLGLTATPERADGRSIYTYFQGRVAAEIRLWEAIERKLLSPFHYFGVTDNVDLRQVQWVAGNYDERELENLSINDVSGLFHQSRAISLAVSKSDDCRIADGQRYINQPVNGGNVLFFVREYKKEGAFASPFTCLGFADFQSHYGSAPISIVWKMKELLPGFVMKKTVKV